MSFRSLSSEEYYILFHDGDYLEYRRTSTFGGKVSSSLLRLKHLSYLDLSFNNFRGAVIPEFIGSMDSLRYLNLSEAEFGGIIPPHLGNLSNLNYLDFHFNSLQVENLDWLTGLSSLEFLDLSGVNLSQYFDWLKVINSLPCLVELHLSYCSLSDFSHSSIPNLNFSSISIIDLSVNSIGGSIPNSLQNMSLLLRELHLSSNDFNSSIPSWLYDLTHLQLLDLSYNGFMGQVSRGIRNLTSLVSLDLSYNLDLEIEKEIFNLFQKFCNLRTVSMSRIKLRQEINDVLATMSGCVSSVLQYLDIRDSQLTGHLTDDLSHFKNLKYLDISENLISGSIPSSFGNLKELEYVDISSNNLEGNVSQIHFANLTRLIHFKAYAMKENLALTVSSNWIPPLQLQTLLLRSWNIGSQFPKWLRLLKHLTVLDLSNSGISSLVPIWFWDLVPNFYYLDLSYNKMHGSIPNIPFADESEIMIDLRSNNFSGALPYFSSNISALHISHNSFSGLVSNFLCYNIYEEKKMTIINLEGNLLHGEIPDCWESWSNLVAIKLSNNSFSGNIPNSIGTLSELQSLHLRQNNLTGQIPSSIQNCTNLFLLDISENSLDGKIPTWIGDRFSKLIILDFHANKFDGHLPKELCHLVSLQVLDLSHNRFFGTIPSCFGKFNAMATKSDSTGFLDLHAMVEGDTSDSALLAMKGKVMEYRSNLGFVRSIDLSNNIILGEIPREITNLTELLSLNLSQNSLTGKIPNNIGDMKGLEPIDFSRNQLFGEIPQSMSTLTFLGTLNLSYNNLSGRIPLGTQLQSFNSSSFMGNYLCGLPLTSNCTSNNVQPYPHTEGEDIDEDEVDVWFYESLAYGFVLGFWGAVCSLVLIKRWRYFFFRSLCHFGQIIWWNLFGRFLGI